MKTSKNAMVGPTDGYRVKIAASDIDGILRGKFIHQEKLISALEHGFGFCSVIFGWDCNDACYDISKVSGTHNGYPDAIAKIDQATKRIIPWQDDAHFYLADFYDQNYEPLQVCPRQVLKRQIAKAENAGFAAMFGLEFEWFNFLETPDSLREKNFCELKTFTPGMFGYSILRASQNHEFFRDLIDSLEKFGVPLEGVHTETGPGVLEAAILASSALEAADRAILFKSVVKEIAHRHQVTATFMAKWNTALPGSSGHMHQSLWDQDFKTNLFYDHKAPHHVSSIFESYVAGQLLLMPDLMPFYAPNINSYKRLVEGFWAPTKASWGIDNRTCALRAILGHKKSTRVETRVSGADINPYLAVAASLGSGLYGIENKLKLEQPPVIGNAYHDTKALALPKTLSEATMRMEKSKHARNIFGDDFIDHFAATRHWEWKQFNNAVTDFELKRYFEII